MTDELREELDRLAAEAPAAGERREQVLHAARRRSHVGLTLASGAVVAGVLVGVLTLGAVLDRRATDPVVPAPTGTVATRPPSATPAPAPIGEVAFLRDGQLVTIRADGTNASTVGGARGATRVSWSPGGTFVVDRPFPATGEAVRGGSIEAIDPSGRRIRLWQAGDGAPRSPDVSPDGRRVAWVTDSGALFTMASDGTDRQEVGVIGAYPTWSPDGSSLAFITTGGDIATIHADGSGRARPIMDAGEAGEVDAIDWGPDGRIVFTTDLAGEGFLYLANADGTGLRPLLEEPGAYGQPAWSPDGSFVVYLDTRGGGRTDVFIVSADGSSPTRITNDASVERSPVWRPGS